MHLARREHESPQSASVIRAPILCRLHSGAPRRWSSPSCRRWHRGPPSRSSIESHTSVATHRRYRRKTWFHLPYSLGRRRHCALVRAIHITPSKGVGCRAPVDTRARARQAATGRSSPPLRPLPDPLAQLPPKDSRGSSHQFHVKLCPRSLVGRYSEHAVLVYNPYYSQTRRRFTIPMLGFCCLTVRF